MESQKNFRAAGRLKPGEMNKTERAFAELLEVERLAGRVVWWEYEAIKLRLAPNCFLTVDFAVLYADLGVLTMIDVKGAKILYTDDAKVKMKLAAEKFPFDFKVTWPIAKKLGGGWEIVAAT